MRDEARAGPRRAARRRRHRDQAAAGAPARRARAARLRPHAPPPDDPAGAGGGMSVAGSGTRRLGGRARGERGRAPTAPRLIAQLARVRGLGARVLPAARALGARRRASRRRRARARRRCATRPTASRRRSTGLEEPLGALPARARGRRSPRADRGTASPAPPSSSTGSPCSTRAGVHVLPRPRRAGVSRAGRARARARRAQRAPRASTRCPTASSLWAGLFDLRENLLGRARRRPARARRFLADTLARACCCAPAHRRRLDQPRPRRARPSGCRGRGRP